MANWQVISLDTTTPQLRAPGTGDGYSFNSGSTQLGVWTTTGLGIGTTNPVGKLVVSNAGAAGIEFFPTGGVGGGPYYNAYNRSTSAYIQFTNYASAYTWYVSTAGNVRAMDLDASGNLGLGVTPSAWDTSIFRALQVGSGAGSAVLFGRTDNANNAGLSVNYYYGAGNYRYLANGYASYYNQQNGVHSWHIAPSNTSGAGAIASFTQAMTLDVDGELGVGITSPTARVHAYSATAMKQLTVDGVGAIKTGVNFASGGTTYGQIYFDNNSPYDMSVVQQYTTGSLIFGTNSTERARIPAAGGMVVGTAALATNATDGFLYIPGCAGTPTGTPTAYTGRVPLVVDTTNNKLYFYSGGAWRDAGP